MQENGKPLSPVWLGLILLLGLAIRLLGFQWGQGYCHIGPSDALEAYSFTVDYARGEPKAQYLAQPNFNPHAKLPGPLWTLFCFAGLRAWGTIDGVVLEIILLNTAAIYLTWLLARRTVGSPASLWAALLAATLPFSVFYSVSIYNPNVMPFLGALLFLTLWETIQRSRSRSIFGVVLVLMVMPQFHMAVTMLLPAVALVLLLASVPLNRGWLLAGFLFGGLTYFPYLRGEMSHGWQNTLGMLSASGRYGAGGLKALTAPLSLLTNWVPQWTSSFAAYRELGAACFGWFGLFIALNLLSAVVAVLLVGRVALEVRRDSQGLWKTPREVFRRFPGLFFLVTLVAVPLLCAAVSGKNFRSHYAIVLFPALLGLAGWAVTAWRASPRFGAWVTAGVVVVACANAWFMPALFWQQGRSIENAQVFLPSFRKLERVYQQLKAHAGTRHGVKVEDSAYCREFAGHEDGRLNARLISRYVLIREKEAAMLFGTPSLSVTYALRAQAETSRADPAVAYWDNGIALVAEPAKP